MSTSSADSRWFNSEGDEENNKWEGGDYFDKEDNKLVSLTNNSSDNVV